MKVGAGELAKPETANRCMKCFLDSRLGNM